MKSEYTYEVAVSYYAGSEEVKLKTSETDDIVKFFREMMEAPFEGKRPLGIVRPVEGPDLYDNRGYAMLFYGPGRRYRASLEADVWLMKTWMAEVSGVLKELGL